jgi:outer membrane biosynthesis protein TonB
MLKIPDMTIKEEGVVYVEVHVNKDGTIRDARVISTPKYSTTITSATIRNECVNRARNTRYEPGKEELRIIEFRP